MRAGAVVAAMSRVALLVAAVAAVDLLAGVWFVFVPFTIAGSVPLTLAVRLGIPALGVVLAWMACSLWEQERLDAALRAELG